MRKSVAALIAVACGVGVTVSIIGANYRNGFEDGQPRIVHSGGIVHYVGETVDEVKKSLNDEFHVSVEPEAFREEQSLNSTDIVATGDELRVSIPGRGTVNYQVVVKGDVEGTGKPGIEQVTAVAYALSGDRELDSAQTLAADVNNSGDVGLADLVILVKYARDFAAPGGDAGASVRDASVPEIVGARLSK